MKPFAATSSVRRLRSSLVGLPAVVAGLVAIQPAPLHAQDSTASPHGRLDVPCVTCHTADGWRPAQVQASFRHGKYGFELNAAHGAVPCAGCHRSLLFSAVERTCAACHQDVHRGELGLDCAQCHGTRSFADRTDFTERHALTRFPLEGVHRAVDCRSCHALGSQGTLVFRGAPTECVSCHRADFSRAKDPSHVAAKFAANCPSCHTGLMSWATGRYDHQATRFPLTGAHRAATCQQCHADNVFDTKPTNCVACHQSDAASAKAPPHAGFPNDCTSCHTTTAWQGATFDHQSTQFPLTGKHLTAICQQCHADGVYRGKPTACLSCHTADFNGTTDPKHQAAGFSTSCTQCHGTATWQGATFDHQATSFPLTGAHLAASCQQCHADGVYVGKPTTCISCHQTDYGTTADPPHQAAGFAPTCATCHSTVTWANATFDHNATPFPLTGKHQTVTCSQCHQNNVYRGLPQTCVSCHQTDYASTTNPKHQAAGFPTDCTTCHTTATWLGVAFDHAKTQFPLTGAHQAATCVQCHSDGVFVGKPTTCVSCHQPDYQKTANPPHQAAGFGPSCQTCHTTVAWTGAVFNHSSTAFPLTGAHVAATCAQCHASGVYRGLPATCVSCHQTDYAGTTNPGHAAAQFPTTCNTCHTTATWLGATFNHDGPYFPIYSGKHRGQWSTCADCHTNAAAYVAFTCLNCHAHPKSQTDADHRGRSGYSYNSNACYSCHPKGVAN